MADKKLSNIILRVNPEVHDEFRAAAKTLGSNKSSLIHQFVFKTIREAKQEDPIKFAEELAKLKKAAPQIDYLSDEDAAKINTAHAEALVELPKDNLFSNLHKPPKKKKRA